MIQQRLGTKICKRCDKEKSSLKYGKDPKFKDGTNSICKECISTQRSTFYANNKDRLKRTAREVYNPEAKKIYREKNAEKSRAYAKAYHLQNSDRINEGQRKRYYTEDGKASAVARVAKRRAVKLKATPEWVLNNEDEMWKIRQFYVHAKEQEELTGVKFHVDHIIPLQGKTVCGFHCVDNLQIITAHENLSKNNRLDGDIL